MLRTLCSIVVLTTLMTTASARELEFSGKTWLVRDSNGAQVGPGPNVFSAAEDSVFIDSEGKLHLRISKTGQVWSSSEVILSEPLGYGTYELQVETNPFGMDQQAVFGFFTFSRAPEQSHRELDVELSYWARSAEENNAQFVVQPESLPDAKRRFVVNHSGTIYRINWGRGFVEFSALTAEGTSIQYWRKTTNVPDPADASLEINLWLFKGAAPQNNSPVEFVVKRFTFTPAENR
ncbi:hypothetical protein WJ96_04620 [Burkholderia ubonensis]|uniref:GH16 domain-containing protein n=2 Tax=Burkholderia ubonensis TaxID=101571 RepID=A0AAW3MV93_9BURK|nr:hypothetical protein WJ93_24355 [Burkholderia ubonensis]KVP97858.1 hypothetical protein WJ96_04620 [Burkholderia ubonensis]KVZ92555.1 hypothetical protein WL25_16275 [Burkholderia ubonensis]